MTFIISFLFCAMSAVFASSLVPFNTPEKAIPWAVSAGFWGALCLVSLKTKIFGNG